MLSRSETLLFAVLFLTFAYFYQGGFSNPNTRWNLALAIAYEGRPQIDTFHANTIDKARVGTHFYAEKSPVLSWLALPAALVTRALVSEPELLTDERLADLSLWLGTVLTISLLSAFSAPFFARLLVALHPALTREVSLGLAAITYLGTLAFPYSTVLMGHQLAASFLIFALYFLIRERLAPAAFFFSLMGVTELTTIPLAILFWLGRPSRFSRSVLAVLPPLVLFAAHNYWCWGNPFSLGYGRLQGTPFATGMSRGAFGVGWPSPVATYQLLLGEYRGLFVYCPLLVAALVGHAYWKKRGPYLAGALLMLLIDSGYFYWQGGPCFGPRHLVVAIPLLALGLGALPPTRIARTGLALVAIPSIAINLVGTSVFVFPEEWDPTPLRSLFALFRDGRLSINPMSFTTAFSAQAERWETAHAHSAFNWGEYFGLSGLPSLLPILSVWFSVAVATIIYRKLSHLFPSRRSHETLA